MSKYGIYNNNISFSNFLNNLQNFIPSIKYKDNTFDSIENKNNNIFFNSFANIDNSKSITLNKINSIFFSFQRTEGNMNYSTIFQDKIKNITNNFSHINKNFKNNQYIEGNNSLVKNSVLEKNINFMNSKIFNNINYKQKENNNEKKFLSLNNKIIIYENSSPHLLINNNFFKSTNFNHHNNNQNSNNEEGKEKKEKMIKMKVPLYRQDYYVKQFKVRYSCWLRNLLNTKVKNLLKGRREQIKFHPLNSLKFTANPKYEDNKLFLSLPVKEILVFGIESDKSSNQRKNKESIIAIENKYLFYNKVQGEEIINLLNSSMEDSIKLFYKSKEFEEFRNITTIREYDEKLIQEKGFSLLKPFGFIGLIKNYKGNCKTQTKSNF